VRVGSPPSPSIKVDVLAYATGVVLACAGAIWRASSLEGDMYAKWNDRVEVALAALAERARLQAFLLQAEISTVLGGGAEFDPTTVVADPATITHRAADFQRTMSTHASMRKRLNVLLWVCKWLWLPPLLVLVGAALAGLDFSKLVINGMLGDAGLAIAAVGSLVGVVGFAMYHVYQRRLVSSEILTLRPIT
jgi:hypothetical protein